MLHLGNRHVLPRRWLSGSPLPLYVVPAAADAATTYSVSTETVDKCVNSVYAGFTERRQNVNGDEGPLCWISRSD